MDQISLSIVLPVRDIATALAASVAECLAVAAQHTADYELIIIDDGSSDGTAEQSARLAATHAPVAVLHYPRPRGYRYALHDGWSVARGEYILGLDLRAGASIADLPRLLSVINDNAVVTGYRIPPPRGLRARLFAAVIRARVAPELRDPALRFALFRADLRGLLAPQGPEALAHAELYAAARHHRLKTAQVAVAGKRGQRFAPSTRALTEALFTPLPTVQGSPALHPQPTPDIPGDQLPRRTRQSATVGIGMLIAAGGLWLLRRWRRHP